MDISRDAVLFALQSLFLGSTAAFELKAERLTPGAYAEKLWTAHADVLALLKHVPNRGVFHNSLDERGYEGAATIAWLMERGLVKVLPVDNEELLLILPAGERMLALLRNYTEHSLDNLSARAQEDANRAIGDRLVQRLAKKFHDSLEGEGVVLLAFLLLSGAVNRRSALRVERNRTERTTTGAARDRLAPYLSEIGNSLIPEHPSCRKWKASRIPGVIQRQTAPINQICRGLFSKHQDNDCDYLYLDLWDEADPSGSEEKIRRVLDIVVTQASRFTKGADSRGRLKSLVQKYYLTVVIKPADRVLFTAPCDPSYLQNVDEIIDEVTPSTTSR